MNCTAFRTGPLTEDATELAATNSIYIFSSSQLCGSTVPCTTEASLIAASRAVFSQYCCSLWLMGQFSSWTSTHLSPAPRQSSNFVTDIIRYLIFFFIYSLVAISPEMLDRTDAIKWFLSFFVCVVAYPCPLPPLFSALSTSTSQP